MASFEQLVFEIIAKDAQASAAFDKFRNSVDKTSASVDKNSAALDKNAKSQDKNKQSNVSALGALLGVGSAFLPITAGAAAAGVGISAFGALAVPSVKKVATALTAKGGLADSWVTLDNRQRNAALGIQALGDDYQDLAKKMEPQVFQVFNQGLSLAHSLLGPTGQLARSSGQGISDFLATFSASSGLQHFITYLSTIARPAIGLLGSDVTHTVHAVFALLQSFGGTGILELRALTGVFTALDDSVSFLSQHAPGLTSTGLAIGGIALALSKLGLLSGALKITGISSIAGQMTGFVAATEGATVAEKGLLATTTALDAITPFGWVALGAAALGGLVFWLSRTRTTADQTVTSLEAQNKAVGFNTAGYLAAAAAIRQTSDQQGQATIQLRNARSGMVTGTASINALTGATDTYTAAQKALIAGAREQDSFLGTLSVKYGLTAKQAATLATAAGILVDKTGHIKGGLANAVAQTEAYANANLAARNPVTQLAADIQDFANGTLTATQRQTALTNALKLFFDPAVKADQDVITMKNDQVALATALANSGGKTGLLTQAQRDARGAFATYINDVATAAQDAFAATGRTSSYTKIIRDALPTLYAAAAGNKTLRGEIQKLIDTMHGLTPEKVSLSVGATGTWTVTQFQAPGGGKHAVNSALGRLVQGGIPGRDSVLVNAMPGELIVPTRLVDSGAVDHLRGQIPGFADGGVVGSYRGTPPGLGRFLRTEDAATLAALERSVARAALAGIHAAARGAPPGTTGTAVGVVQQWAKAHLADYGWGPAQFPPLQALWNQESGWRWDATNPASGAYGIPQALPASKMASAGSDWLTNPVTQMRWGLSYIRAVYGSPAGAEAHELSAHWYDGGGYLPPGPSIAINGTGRPERVGGGDVNITINVRVGHGTNPRQAAKEIADLLNQGAVAGIRLRKSILSANG